MKNATVLFILLLLSVACNRGQDRVMGVRLQQWDAALEASPLAVKEGLAAINPRELSPSNRAYYGLLKTIAEDKTFTEIGRAHV